MKTILDDAKTWFLHGVVYQDELYVIVIEGFVGEPTEEITIADYTIKDLSPIEISKDSRTMAVRFPHFVAWQVVDESYSSSDEYENHEDSGKLSTLSRSKYLDYVRDNHGWFESIIGPAKHYRVWTENEIIDVVACKPPVVERWEGKL